MLCTEETLPRAMLNPDRKFGNMAFIGNVDSCESFLNNISISGDVDDEQKNSLRAVKIALKSRKTKTLRDFQKRRYGTLPTVIWQHATRTRAAIPEISRLFDHGHDIEEQGTDENVKIENNGEDVQEYLFEAGETVVFRGTDGLKFNLQCQQKM